MTTLQQEFQREFETRVTGDDKDNRYFADFALEQLDLDWDSDAKLEHLKEHFKGDFDLITEFYGIYHIHCPEELKNVSAVTYYKLKELFDN